MAFDPGFPPISHVDASARGVPSSPHQLAGAAAACEPVLMAASVSRPRDATCRALLNWDSSSVKAPVLQPPTDWLGGGRLSAHFERIGHSQTSRSTLAAATSPPSPRRGCWSTSVKGRRLDIASFADRISCSTQRITHRSRGVIGALDRHEAIWSFEPRRAARHQHRITRGCRIGQLAQGAWISPQMPQRAPVAHCPDPLHERSRTTAQGTVKRRTGTVRRYRCEPLTGDLHYFSVAISGGRRLRGPCVRSRLLSILCGGLCGDPLRQEVLTVVV
jgi:hypothetical protein